MEPYMLYPQLLVVESDGLLAATLRSLAESRQWVLREPRRLAACLRLVRRLQPAALILKLATDIVTEMTIVERVHWLRPQTPIVIVSDVENAVWAACAWHLGAAFVLMPPQPRSLLPAVVTSLMENAIREQTTKRVSVPPTVEPLPEPEPLPDSES